MRFVLAAIAFVASAVALVFGAVAFHDASETTTVTASGTSQSTAPVTVVHSDVLASRIGQQDVQIRGTGPINVVIGRSSDIDAWVGDARHDTVEIDKSAPSTRERLTLKFTESGSESTVPTPIGNDMWYQVYQGQDEVQFSGVVAPGFAMLITADGNAAAPASLSITWPLGGYAPTAGPLLVAGSLLLVLTAVLTWWAIAHRCRGIQLPAAARVSVSARFRAASGTAANAAASWNVAARERSAQAPWSAVPWDEELHRRTEQEAAWAAPVLEREEARKPHDAAKAESGWQSAQDWAAVNTARGIGEPAEAPLGLGTPSPEEAPGSVDAAASEVAESTAEPDSEPIAAAEAAPEADAVPEAADETTPEPTPVTDRLPAPEAPQASSVESSTETASGAAEAESDEAKWKRPRGKNRARAPKQVFFAAPVAVVIGLSLSGCGPQYWPTAWTNANLEVTGTATSSVDAALLKEGAQPPALNEQQLADVLADAASVAAQGDASLNAQVLQSRFTADALMERTALYQAKAADAQLPAPAAFPSGKIAYAVPESSGNFPRTVFAVVNGAGSENEAPSAVMLVQNSARENFKVASVVQLAPNVELPDAAPASIGAPGLDKLPGDLVIAPDQLASDYADVIAKGDSSEHAGQFAAANDSLRASVNQAYRDAQVQALDPEATTVQFQYAAGSAPPLGVTSLDDGAIIAVSITETERVTAANERARISVTGATAALSGLSLIATGFERVYTDQLLFYVPSASKGGQVQFLGVSQAMTSAHEVNQ